MEKETFLAADGDGAEALDVSLHLLQNFAARHFVHLLKMVLFLF